MPQITLTRAQVQSLVDFCSSHQLKQFFIAKDHGAYLGAAAEGQNLLYFFNGCNPSLDPHWYDEALGKFGGDDFGEDLPTTALHNALALNDMKRMVFTVEKTRILMEVHR